MRKARGVTVKTLKTIDFSWTLSNFGERKRYFIRARKAHKITIKNRKRVYCIDCIANYSRCVPRVWYLFRIVFSAPIVGYDYNVYSLWLKRVRMKCRKIKKKTSKISLEIQYYAFIKFSFRNARDYNQNRM